MLILPGSTYFLVVTPTVVTSYVPPIPSSLSTTRAFPGALGLPHCSSSFTLISLEVCTVLGSCSSVVDDLSTQQWVENPEEKKHLGYTGPCRDFVTKGCHVSSLPILRRSPNETGIDLSHQPPASCPNPSPSTHGSSSAERATSWRSLPIPLMLFKQMASLGGNRLVNWYPPVN